MFVDFVKYRYVTSETPFPRALVYNLIVKKSNPVKVSRSILGTYHNWNENKPHYDEWAFRKFSVTNQSIEKWHFFFVCKIINCKNLECSNATDVLSNVCKNCDFNANSFTVLNLIFDRFVHVTNRNQACWNFMW